MSMPSDLTERDVEQAWAEFQRRSASRPGHPVADMHGLVQQFGAQGYPLELPTQAIMPITKRVRLVEWTVDSTIVGSIEFRLMWSDWQIPRVWRELVGPG